MGVSRLVRFGTEPAKVADELIDILRTNEAQLQAAPEQLFKPGERVRLTDSPFAGIEGIYQMAEGERRVMVLIEILSKPMKVPVAPASLRKVY
jgi:transcriptional antiterminator RfaH